MENYASGAQSNQSATKNTFHHPPPKKDKEITGVPIGDVWLCSGQSNMVMPLAPLAPSFEGVIGYQNEIANASDSILRFTIISPVANPKEQDTLAFQVKWKICTPSSVGGKSAVAYYFARKLTGELHLPIGIIISAVNGSNCESWVSQNSLQYNKDLNNYYRGAKSIYFNGMIKPLAYLSVSGFLWYQGESNRRNIPDRFSEITRVLITDWRNTFQNDRLPFYFVQLTPYDEGSTGNPFLNDYARIREAQAHALLVPNTGMAVTLDLGEINKHHPRKKKPVGERLAMLALKQTYHKNSVGSLGPQYKSFEQDDSTITINFVRGTASGLLTVNNDPIDQCFAIEGADCRFVKATAEITGYRIIIHIPPNTPTPIVAVRYAFTNFPIADIQNKDGLPMEPFRSDNFWDQ